MFRIVIITSFAITSLVFSGTQAFALTFSAGIPLSHTITGKSADGTTNIPDGTSGLFAFQWNN